MAIQEQQFNYSGIYYEFCLVARTWYLEFMD